MMASRIHREVYVRFWEGFGQTYGRNAARRLIPTLRREIRRRVLDQSGNAALYIPAQIDHAILLQQIIIEFVGCHKTFVVGRLVIDLNGYSSSTVFQNKVSVAAVLIDVIEVILRIEVSGLLCTEGFAEQETIPNFV